MASKIALRGLSVLAATGLVGAQSDSPPSLVDAFDLTVHAGEVCGQHVSGIYRFRGRSEEHIPYFYRAGVEGGVYLAYAVCGGDVSPSWYFAPMLPNQSTLDVFCNEASSFLGLPMESPGILSATEDATWRISSCQSEVSVSIRPMQPDNDDVVLFGFHCWEELTGLWKVVPDSQSAVSQRPMYHLETFGGSYVMMYKEDLDECPHLNNRWSIWHAQDADAGDGPCRGIAWSSGSDEMRPLQFGWYEDCDYGQKWAAVETLSRTRTMTESPCRENFVHFIADNVCHMYDPLAHCPYNCDRLVRTAEHYLCTPQDLMPSGEEAVHIEPSARRLEQAAGSCEDTDLDGATDSWGYGCSHYTANTDECGDSFDTESFSSLSMCCACGGGGAGGGGGGSCQDTAGSATDSGGDGCSYYADNPLTCGDYDSDDFTASSMCCACGGGSGASTTTSSPAGSCQDTAGVATDSGGDGCSYYADNPLKCGQYDSADFTASSMCCACGGGSGASTATTSSTAGSCQDTAGVATDSGGDGCSYYTDNPLKCGQYDSADFTASSMCCACGGGSGASTATTSSTADATTTMESSSADATTTTMESSSADATTTTMESSSAGMIPILDLVHQMKNICEPNVECYSQLTELFSEESDHCMEAVCNDTEDRFHEPCFDKHQGILNSCSGTEANMKFWGSAEKVFDVFESKSWCYQDDNYGGGAGECVMIPEDVAIRLNAMPC